MSAEGDREFTALHFDPSHRPTFTIWETTFDRNVVPTSKSATTLVDGGQFVTRCDVAAEKS